MTPLEAKAALEAAKASGKFDIRVRTKSGAEYDVAADIVEAASDDYHADDAYVYGVRMNGRVHIGGRRRVDTRHQIKWFLLSNVTLVAEDYR